MNAIPNNKSLAGQIHHTDRDQWIVSFRDEIAAYSFSGLSGGAMVLGKLPVLGRPTIWMIVGQGPIALAVGAGGVC